MGSRNQESAKAAAREEGRGARPAIFALAAAVHLGLLFFVTFRMSDGGPQAAESLASVMKLTDVAEYVPPPPPKIEVPEVSAKTVETIAEKMIVTDDSPDEDVVKAGALVTPSPDDYMPMNKISVPPAFSERDIRSTLEYPAIALRSGVEGTVYLELYVDRNGVVRQITVLKETPPDRGFGEAAVKAFLGLRGTPAIANGKAVAVKYRYPVRFTIKK